MCRVQVKATAVPKDSLRQKQVSRLNIHQVSLYRYSVNVLGNGSMESQGSNLVYVM
jgi:hypothetical protein